MRRTTLSRRTVLRGLLGGAMASVALPPLEAMFNGNGTAYADGAMVPKRFGVFFWGNGIRESHWTPSATGASWVPSESLRPLVNVKDYINVVTGMEIKTGNPRGHHAGTVGILSGAPLSEREHATDSFASTFSQPSIDVVAARTLGMTARRPNLQVGVSRRVTTGEGTTLRYLSHNGPDNANPPAYNPQAVFDLLFGTGFTPPGSTNQPNPRLALRRSVLDVVRTDATALRGTLGATDRTRLDQHLEGIATLERQIQDLPAMMPVASACALPTAPGTFPDMAGREQLQPIARAMSDLLVMAYACDLTRVFSMMFSGSVGGTTFWPVGATQEMHGLTHDEGGDQPTVQAGVVFIMQQFAYLLERLRAVPEGAGNLLDSCAILATSDLSNGHDHTNTEYPIVIAGKAGGGLRYPGVHYRSTTRENTSKVLLSLLRSVGVPITEFGVDGGHVTAGCTAIEP